jgi:hypothetical protein
MGEPNRALFVDLDPRTGQPTPTTYESMRAAMSRWDPVSADIPDDIRELLLAAADYFALAYDWHFRGRGRESRCSDGAISGTCQKDLVRILRPNYKLSHSDDIRRYP